MTKTEYWLKAINDSENFEHYFKKIQELFGYSAALAYSDAVKAKKRYFDAVKKCI